MADLFSTAKLNTHLSRNVERMKFVTPGDGVEFEIPDEWWSFAEMSNFSAGSAGNFYPYHANQKPIEVVPIADIESPIRNAGFQPFRKYKLVPVLLAFTSPECALPPVEVVALPGGPGTRYRVINGFHRYYASIAAGYTKLPVIVRSGEHLL